MTNKSATATASIVAAVPAAVLGFFLVKTFLTGLGQLTTMFLGLYGVTLAACAAIVFLPFAIMIFGPKSPARQAGSSSSDAEKEPAKEPGKLEPAVEESFEEPVPDLDADVFEEAADEPISTGELEIVDSDLSESGFDTVEESEHSVAATQSLDAADDDFNFDDEFEDEPPKKKK